MERTMPEIELSPLSPLPTGIDPRGALTPPVQCLLCDIYGTLFISGSGDIGTSRRQETPHSKIENLLARYRINIGAADLPEKLHAAIEARHADIRADGIDNPEVKIDEIWAQILRWETGAAARPFALEFEMIMNPVWPMPGLTDLLKVCRENEILLGIISNAQFFTLSLFERFLGADVDHLGFHPDLRFLSYRHGIAKPSAGLFQMAVSRLRQMGISTENTVYIGNDMRNDIVPSRDAHFQTVLFAGDARSLRLRKDDPRCAGVQPDLVVTQLTQLIPFLEADSKKQ